MSAATLPKCGRSSRTALPAFAIALIGAILPSGAAGDSMPVSGSSHAPSDTLVVGDFSGAAPDTLPVGWRGLNFPAKNAHTLYRVVPDAEHGRGIESHAIRSASGHNSTLSVDPREWPVLRWRWKTSRLVAGSDLTKKSGDDYPARIYVAFAHDPGRLSFLERAWYAAARLFYGEYPPQAGLNYVWDGKAPAGTIAPNAYTARVRMIVVESGPRRLGEWIAYERNIADDYRTAFGEEPPAVSGVAIMTDTDNTGESVTSWYGDITLARAPR
jgi:hypothetical protein